MTEKKTKKPPVRFEVFIEYEYDAEMVEQEQTYAPGFGTVKGERAFWKDVLDPSAKKVRIHVEKLL